MDHRTSTTSSTAARGRADPRAAGDGVGRGVLASGAEEGHDRGAELVIAAGVTLAARSEAHRRSSPFLFNRRAAWRRRGARLEVAGLAGAVTAPSRRGAVGPAAAPARGEASGHRAADNGPYV
jgi:hypothetical protein